jgi:hypothetical protein
MHDQYSKIFEAMMAGDGTKPDPMLEKIAHAVQKSPGEVSAFMAAKGYKLDSLTPEQYQDIIDSKAELKKDEKQPNSSQTTQTTTTDKAAETKKPAVSSATTPAITSAVKEANEEPTDSLDLNTATYFMLELIRETLGGDKNAAKTLSQINKLVDAKFSKLSPKAAKVSSTLSQKDQEKNATDKLDALYKMVRSALQKQIKSTSKSTK